ncbi:MAG: tripartite tricarboxylate transporter substrate binding protein [Hydrogenophaga sp.]|nr:tripartite tricarboxylate transporter substrate binding protein [Hydrogenophaga sp.]
MASIPHLTRRLLLATTLACVAGTTLAQASDYPSRPVTVVVPFAPGGSVDSAARLALQALSERLKQPFVVENVAGASGTIGSQRVARAAPDGYTLLFAVASPINVAPVVKPSIVRYDALKDFAPVATVASSPFVLIGSPRLAAPATADVIAMARQSPGKLNYGTDGVGTSMHLTAEIIKLSAGIDVVHVPYKNGPQVLTEVSSGLIELAVMPVTLAQPFIKDGKVKAYGVTSRQRWPSLPDVPALAETPALKTVDVDSWYGLLAPAGTDAAIVARLAGAVREALKDPGLVEKMGTAGLKPMVIERAEFAALLKLERETLAAAVKAAGIQPE